MKHTTLLLLFCLTVAGTIRPMNQSASDDESDHPSEIIDDYVEAPTQDLGETHMIKQRAQDILRNKQASAQAAEKAADELTRKRQEKLKKVTEQQERIKLLKGQRALLTSLIDKFQADLATTEKDEAFYTDAFNRLKEQVKALKGDDQDMLVGAVQHDDNLGFDEELSAEEIKRRAESEVGAILEPGIARKQKMLKEVREYLQGLRGVLAQLNTKLLQAGEEVGEAQADYQSTIQKLKDIETIIISLSEAYEGSVVDVVTEDINDRRAEEARKLMLNVPQEVQQQEVSKCLLL